MKPLITKLAPSVLFAIFAAASGFSQETTAPPPANADAKLMPNRCDASSGLGDIAAKPSWNGWGAGFSNARFQESATAQLDAGQVPKLRLKWAFGFPGAKAVYGQPTVVAGRVFLGVDTGFVYSIDAATGCVYWSYQATGPVRSAVTIGPAQSKGQYLAYFGDLKGNVYAVDAASGEQVWKINLDNHPVARITGSITVSMTRCASADARIRPSQYAPMPPVLGPVSPSPTRL